MSMGCAKSFAMIYFDFLRCTSRALYFLGFDSMLHKSHSIKVLVLQYAYKLGCCGAKTQEDTTIFLKRFLLPSAGKGS